MSETMDNIEETDYNPYCPICTSCGESGCCSPIGCEQHPTGMYCRSSLVDLKFGYHMNRWFANNILRKLDAETQAQWDAEWDAAWEEFYNPKKTQTT